MDPTFRSYLSHYPFHILFSISESIKVFINQSIAGIAAGASCIVLLLAMAIGVCLFERRLYKKAILYRQRRSLPLRRKHSMSRPSKTGFLRSFSFFVPLNYRSTRMLSKNGSIDEKTEILKQMTSMYYDGPAPDMGGRELVTKRQGSFTADVSEGQSASDLRQSTGEEPVQQNEEHVNFVVKHNKNGDNIYEPVTNRTVKEPEKVTVRNRPTRRVAITAGDAINPPALAILQAISLSTVEELSEDSSGNNSSASYQGETHRIQRKHFSNAVEKYSDKKSDDDSELTGNQVYATAEQSTGRLIKDDSALVKPTALANNNEDPRVGSGDDNQPIKIKKLSTASEVSSPFATSVAEVSSDGAEIFRTTVKFPQGGATVSRRQTTRHVTYIPVTEHRRVSDSPEDIKYISVIKRVNIQ